MTREEIIESCAKAAHDAWLTEKEGRLRAYYIDDGEAYITWPNERGEEQLVPWEQLSEGVRDFDRIVVGAIVDVMVEKGVVSLP